jgi:hypothetical protein
LGINTELCIVIELEVNKFKTKGFKMSNEELISDMMKMNVCARLWHWTTDIAQHHTTYEQFLTQNELFTDSLVESTLGNDTQLDFSKIGVNGAVVAKYSLEDANKSLRSYRERVFQVKKNLEEVPNSANAELITILDNVTELASKTLYLLKLK